MGTMDVGKPIRIHEVEPLEDPVPRREKPQPRPERKPVPTETPAK